MFHFRPTNNSYQDFEDIFLRILNSKVSHYLFGSFHSLLKGLLNNNIVKTEQWTSTRHEITEGEKLLIYIKCAQESYIRFVQTDIFCLAILLFPMKQIVVTNCYLVIIILHG